MTHFIFSTKDRVPYIDAELKPRLLAYMGGIVNELGGEPLIINGVADHVHLLVRLRPAVAPAELLRVLKTNSSRWVHEEWKSRSAFGWQTGYGAFSVSESNVRRVSRYIAEQEEHHRKVSFQEEFMTFLRKHRIDYDERYIWE
jgi:putative transposase